MQIRTPSVGIVSQIKTMQNIRVKTAVLTVYKILYEILVYKYAFYICVLLYVKSHIMALVYV